MGNKIKEQGKDEVIDNPIPFDNNISRTFKEELTTLINKYNKENNSNTPDFIIAQYIEGCLSSFNLAVQQREAWHGRELRSSDHRRYGVKLNENNSR